MGGRVRCRQSSADPSRTIKALVNAATLIARDASTTQIPVEAGGGGVVGVLHSREVACHGLSEAGSPQKRLWIRLYRKMSCAAPVTNAAMVMNLCNGTNRCM